MITGARRWLLRNAIRRLRPIVIGGCARSGTSLLLSVLSSHKRILAIPGETQLLCPGAYWPPAGGIAKPDLEALYERLTELDLSAGCQAWCEKTPRNVHNIELILETLGPETWFLNIIRDGRDVVLSRHPKKPDGYWVSPDRWINDVRAGLSWREHPQILTIRYEDLVESLGQTTRSLCNLMSLQYDERILSYPQHARIQDSESWFEAARPLTRTSIGRWRRPASKQDGDRVKQLLDQPGAVELLSECGYDA